MSKKQVSVIAIVWIFAVILSCVAVYVTFFNRGYTEVSFIDVGQGDSCFIQTERFSSVLIDGGDKGAGNYYIEPFIKENSEDCLDAVFVSHMHQDHISGIVELMDSEIEIGHIYVSEYAESEDGYNKIGNKAREKNIPITVLSGGDVVEIDNVTFKVIGDRYEYTDQNDMSMVLRFECGENSVLFTGDMTHRAEDNVLGNKDIDADILKVAHHGSAGSSDMDFLNEVTAELFVISVGKDNDYNHPSKQAMARLSSFDVPIVRTDEKGTITLVMTEDDIRNIKFSREGEK